MKQVDATILGFLLAPLVPAVMLSLTSTDLTNGGWKVTYAWVIVFYHFTLIVTGALGVPLYLAVRRWGQITWWSVLLSGAAAGTALCTVIQATARPALFGAGAGAAEALVFWIIWRLGRAPADEDSSSRASVS